jgi:hypothetical protein
MFMSIYWTVHCYIWQDSTHNHCSENLQINVNTTYFSVCDLKRILAFKYYRPAVRLGLLVEWLVLRVGCLTAKGRKTLDRRLDRSYSIVHSRTKATQFSFFFVLTLCRTWLNISQETNMDDINCTLMIGYHQKCKKYYNVTWLKKKDILVTGRGGL